MSITYFKYLSFFLFALSISSCSKNLTPFTERLYDDYNWSDDDLQRIQFYLSEDIVLRRQRGNGKANIEDGKISVINGKQVEEIVFREGTPGVMVYSPKRDRVGISFDASTDAYLMFGPNRKAKGRFVLLAKDWEKNFGKVSYNGKTYFTNSSSAYASLLVDLKKAQKVEYKKKTVGGREVN